MTDSKVSELEKLEDLILEYKKETDVKKKHVVYLRLIQETLKLVKKIVIAFYPLPNTISKDDLIQVVEDGTAKDMKVEGRTIAGKTGTAELKA